MRSRMMGLAAAAAMLSAGAMSIEPPRQRVLVRDDHSPKVDEEKTSRQRKRWLQKQARKNMRRHSK